MQGRKKKRIEEQLRREISTICLFELKDPRAGFISVDIPERLEPIVLFLGQLGGARHEALGNAGVQRHLLLQHPGQRGGGYAPPGR